MEEQTAPLSLLLVHTDSDDRTMYAEYLREEGFDVQEAATTDSALPLVPKATAVISGLLVPGSIDAVQFIDRVRREFTGCPIVVVTASADRVDEARAAGADAVLLKPCAPDALLDAVLDALDSKDVRPAVPARRRLSERRPPLRGGGRRDSDLP